MLHPKPQRRRYSSKPRIGTTEVSMGSLRAFVIHRDDGCILKRLEGHVCRGRTGREPGYDSDWTLEHVTGVHGFGDIRRDDDAHTVALCYGSNIDHTNREERGLVRARLRALHPDCSSG
jgi:hypothetical protein